MNAPAWAELWDSVGAGPWLWEGGPEREREGDGDFGEWNWINI